MVVVWMTSSDLWPRFQGHDIIQCQLTQKQYKIELYLQWRTSRMWSIERRHFRWPWTTPNLVFKVTLFFDAEYLINGTTYRHSFNEILIWTYTRLLNIVISNDLKWVSKIFNETKRCAVSLRQLSFLYVSGNLPYVRSYYETCHVPRHVQHAVYACALTFPSSLNRSERICYRSPVRSVHFSHS